MPPRVKISRENIVSTAISLVRESGVGAINARALAKALGSSTQPIFSNFSDMTQLKEAVVLGAYEIYLDFLKREDGSGKYPRYKSFGMAYIRFAVEERELFKLLFMRDRTGEDISASPDFEASAELIGKMDGVDIQTARLMHLEMWTCVHGIGAMAATSFLSLDEELISNVLSDVYNGLRARHLGGVE